jgi:hypothetical protein
MVVWLLSFVRGNFSTVFHTAFVVDLIVTLARVFIASLATVFTPTLAGIFGPVNTSLTPLTLGILAQAKLVHEHGYENGGTQCYAQQTGMHMK